MPVVVLIQESVTFSKQEVEFDNSVINRNCQDSERNVCINTFKLSQRKHTEIKKEKMLLQLKTFNN